jgi:hypothetical protein
MDVRDAYGERAVVPAFAYIALARARESSPAPTVKCWDHWRGS